jgi:hypothetical protein
MGSIYRPRREYQVEVAVKENLFTTDNKLASSAVKPQSWRPAPPEPRASPTIL